MLGRVGILVIPHGESIRPVSLLNTFLYFSCGDGIATVALTYSIEKQEQALIHRSGMSAKPNVK